MKFSAIFLLVAFCCIAVKGQETEVIRTKTELVQTAITVLDKKGHFVEGLQRLTKTPKLKHQSPHPKSQAARSSSSSTIYTSRPTA